MSPFPIFKALGLRNILFCSGPPGFLNPGSIYGIGIDYGASSGTRMFLSNFTMLGFFGGPFNVG